LERVPGVDLVLLVRGGGSLEELWAFNDEAVARAIYTCKLPIVTGVGHETDYTIADFVADLRAPTPSAAAELATPDREELNIRLQGMQQQLDTLASQRLDQIRQKLDRQAGLLYRASPLSRIDRLRQQSDELGLRQDRAWDYVLQTWGSKLGGLGSRLEALSPQATLNRGYAIIRNDASGVVVRSTLQVAAGDSLHVQVSDGDFGATALGETSG
jgi:exodeoxyribonuclease VII large subunit